MANRNNGNSFVRQLSRTTGADILASVDKTGIEGNWELEKTIGKIEADSIFTDSIATAYQHTLDEGDFGIVSAPGIEFEDVDFSESRFDIDDIDESNLGIFAEEGVSFEPVEPEEIEELDFGSVPEDDFGPLAEEGLDFEPLDTEDINQIDFNDVPAEDLSLLANEDLQFEQLNTEDINQIDFSNVPAEDLSLLANSGLDFTSVDSEDISSIDFNSIPPEDIGILTQEGLSLEAASNEAINEVRLGVAADFGSINEDIFAISSLSEDTTFGELSATVKNNANLFNYKDESLNLDDGFSISEAQQLDFNDYKALDFAFDEDSIFNSSYYLEENPDVADDGINPFSQYFYSGAYAPEFRDPSTYFDSSYYLENNPDVADDGINPLFQYFSSGASAPEFRDPDPAFDTSFYLKENPKVAESGINPLFHYFNSGASEGRFANENFKGFEEKGEAWIVNSDISNDEFNNLKNVAKETGGDDGSLLFWIRLYGEIVDYALTFKIVDDTLETVDSLQELIQRSSEEGNVFVLPEDERLTEGNNGDVLTFPAEEFTVPTGTPGFELGEPIGFDDNTFFPKGDGFLDDILNGRFETPNEGEEGTYYLANEISGTPSDDEWAEIDEFNNPSISVSNEARAIANGHGYAKHKNQFPGVQTRDDYAELIDNIINTVPEENIRDDLNKGRKAYWDDATGTLVITDPGDIDGGTAYKPDDGKDEFFKLK